MPTIKKPNAPGPELIKSFGAIDKINTAGITPTPPPPTKYVQESNTVVIIARKKRGVLLRRDQKPKHAASTQPNTHKIKVPKIVMRIESAVNHLIKVLSHGIQSIMVSRRSF